MDGSLRSNEPVAARAGLGSRNLPNNWSLLVRWDEQVTSAVTGIPFKTIGEKGVAGWHDPFFRCSAVAGSDHATVVIAHLLHMARHVRPKVQSRGSPR